jgi:hypothetical protein
MIQIASQADNFTDPVRATAGYTIVTIIGSSIVVGLFNIAIKQWTKGVIFALAFTSTTVVWIGCSLYFWLFSRTVSVSFLNSLWLHFEEVYLMGVICTVLAYFWFRNRNLRSNLQEAEEEKQKLTIRAQKENLSDHKLITLHGDSKDSLTLFPLELLYIESSGNYVQIYYTADNEVRKKTLRATLSKMEEALSDYLFLVRCHRAFIVNTYQIEEINGLKLCLKCAKTEIPISKTYKNNLQKNR